MDRGSGLRAVICWAQVITDEMAKVWIVLGIEGGGRHVKDTGSAQGQRRERSQGAFPRDALFCR